MRAPEPVVLEGHGVRLEPLSRGTVRDSAYSSILAEEWAGVRQGLEARLR